MAKKTDAKKTELVDTTAVETTDLTTVETEDLKRQLVETLEVTVGNLVRMAAIVRELESRGVDLGDLRIGLVGYLRQIAHGRLSAKAVVRFAERPLLLRQVSELPIEDQDRLATGEPVKLAVFQGERIDHRLVDPLDLSADQIRIVFGGPVIRSIQQQVPLLEDRRSRPPKKRNALATGGRLVADPERGGLVFRRTFFPAGDVLEALAGVSQSDDDSDEPLDSKVMISVTEAEHKRLKVMAAQSGTSASALIRDAMRASGLL